MRLLHTADWHLGRIFYGQYLTDDQAHVLEHQFFHILRDEKIDGVLLAGDVFDRAVPPVEAVELWDSIITRLAMDYKIPLFVVSGNHDGAERLEVGRSMLGRSGIHIWGAPQRSLEPYVFEASDGAVAICPMPFSEPRRIAASLGLGESIPAEEPVTNLHNYDHMYQAWSEHLQSQVPNGMRSIALSHAFVMGGEVGGSERTLSLGGSEMVNPAVFKDFHYTALGHLHGPQRMGADYIRYSGSPLKYSFDEHAQKKSFAIVDMDGKGRVEVDTIPVEAKRDVVILEGYFEDLLNSTALQNAHRDDYVQVRLLDTMPVMDGMAKLRQVYHQCMTIELVGRVAMPTAEISDPIFKSLNERELFNQFAESVWQQPLTEREASYINFLWDRIVKED